MTREAGAGGFALRDHVEVFDAVVLALSFEGLQKLLPALPDEAPRAPP